MTIRRFAFALAAAAALAGPAGAGEITVRRAIEAASLRDGPLDMVAYWRPAAGGALEVTATFAPHRGVADPMRVVMALGEGDDVAFALPGHPQVLWRFVRSGGAVTIRSSRVTGREGAGL
jgi:hypothetical protein